LNLVKNGRFFFKKTTPPYRIVAVFHKDRLNPRLRPGLGLRSKLDFLRLGLGVKVRLRGRTDF